jgi:hypothetical protein
MIDEIKKAAERRFVAAGVAPVEIRVGWDRQKNTNLENAPTCAVLAKTADGAVWDLDFVRGDLGRWSCASSPKCSYVPRPTIDVNDDLAMARRLLEMAKTGEIDESPELMQGFVDAAEQDLKNPPLEAEPPDSSDGMDELIANLKTLVATFPKEGFDPPPAEALVSQAALQDEQTSESAAPFVEPHVVSEGNDPRAPADVTPASEAPAVEMPAETPVETPAETPAETPPVPVAAPMTKAERRAAKRAK